MTSSVSTVVALLLYYATIAFSTPLSSQEKIAQVNLKKLAIANNELSIKLLHQLTANSSENIFFSPFSLSTTFGMLYLGAKGNTSKELRTALGYDTADLREELVHQTFHRYLTESLPSRNSSLYVLNVANAALLDKKLNSFPSYKNEVEHLYKASVRDVDFENEGPKIVHEIDSWVKEKTNGKIDSLLECLDSDTAFVLLNAVYFNGAWKTAFETWRTSPQRFFNNGLWTKQTIVPTMNVRARFPVARIKDFRAIELPYSGDNVSMIILLPDEIDGLESMEKNMTREKLTAIRKKLNIHYVDVYLPKFKIEYSREMSQDFKSIGAESIFTPQADFSGIASNPNAFVDQILHKAVVEVNERGSEAAAVTAMKTVFRSGGGGFRVNHPFLFAIVDNRNDMILFLGRVTNL